nr:restriction endonuclease [Microbacterium thalassium]
MAKTHADIDASLASRQDEPEVEEEPDPEREAEERRARRRRLGLDAREPRPEPLPFGVNDHGAELLVRDWMRHLGASDAQLTQAGKDGGIDVISRRYAAQVKNYRGKVVAPEVRELYGVAVRLDLAAIFFTSGKYTADAIAFADAVEMALFVYDAEAGSLHAANGPAIDRIDAGL